MQLTQTAGHFIAGEQRDSDGAELEVFRPESGEVLTKVPVGNADDVSVAVESAASGFRAWAARPPAEKESLLAAVARRIEEQADELAELERANTGKRLDVARDEVLAAAGLFSFYAGYPSKAFGDRIPIADPNILCYTVLEPLGVIAAITPWNYPLMIVAGKVAAALAAGCSVVVKPAPETPLTALELARIVSDCGLPDGALNVITGDGSTGEALAGHPGIAKVSFTGSTATGRKVIVTAGANGRPSTLELGGKSPNLVFGDVDLEKSIEPILMGALTNAGQECCAGARVLVEASALDRFIELAAERIEALRVGSGDDSEIGPLISRRQHDRVAGFVERAIADGATVRARADAPEEGFFYPPTLLTEVQEELEICREEIFGPVLTVDSFESDEEALRMANATRYGLAAGVWTSSIDRSIRFARDLEAGIVWVNSYLAGDAAAPFGGGKDSGFGRELGVEGPRDFSQVKTVYTAGPPA